MGVNLSATLAVTPCVLPEVADRVESYSDRIRGYTLLHERGPLVVPQKTEQVLLSPKSEHFIHPPVSRVGLLPEFALLVASASGEGFHKLPVFLFAVDDSDGRALSCWFTVVGFVGDGVAGVEGLQVGPFHEHDRESASTARSVHPSVSFPRDDDFPLGH